MNLPYTPAGAFADRVRIVPPPWVVVYGTELATPTGVQSFTSRPNPLKNQVEQSARL